MSPGVIAPEPELSVEPTAMMAFENALKEPTEIDPRDIRALTECFTVLPDIGRARGADDLYLVVSQSGREYLVDARTGACECPDHEYRGVRCKHVRRVEFATGRRIIPSNVKGVDELIGLHVGGMNRAVAPHEHGA